MLKAVSMYRSMFVVPGEIVLVLDGPTMSDFGAANSAASGS
jgi:hypothetical protein